MPTKTTTHPIHHITAIASKPKQCVEFYTQTLGLRLVKKSVNQDQVEAYHLFFGDTTGEPGMDLTFFTFNPVRAGVRGAGVVSLISLAVPEASLLFWHQRFEEKKVITKPQETRFGYKRLVFYDPDNQQLELVGLPPAEYRKATGEVWTTAEISPKVAIGAFHSARLSVVSAHTITPILTNVLGYLPVKDATAYEQQLQLFRLKGVDRAAYLEVEEHPIDQVAQSGAGTVHHIAFQVADEGMLRKKQQQLLTMGLRPTAVIDRYYFKSVYFRTPAGILFELATMGPGFTADEPKDALGETLALPPFLEPHRAHIESLLDPI